MILQTSKTILEQKLSLIKQKKQKKYLLISQFTYFRRKNNNRNLNTEIKLNYQQFCMLGDIERKLEPYRTLNWNMLTLYFTNA